MNINMAKLTSLMTTWEKEAKRLADEINLRFYTKVAEPYQEANARITKGLSEDYEHYMGNIKKVEFTLKIMGLQWNNEAKRIEYRWED